MASSRGLSPLGQAASSPAFTVTSTMASSPASNPSLQLRLPGWTGKYPLQKRAEVILETILYRECVTRIGTPFFLNHNFAKIFELLRNLKGGHPQQFLRQRDNATVSYRAKGDSCHAVVTPEKSLDWTLV